MGHPHSHAHGLGHDHVHHAEQVVLDGPAVPLHLVGRLVETGEPVEFWVADGRLHTEPVADAQTVCSDGWIMPGLVDAHCHIGLDAHGEVDRDTTERQALDERDAGVLLVRDAGSPADTGWIDDRDDLPRVIRAGRHIARPRRYIRNYAAEVEPDDLVAEVERQVARGDGWVKLVGDWIDRDLGDLAPLWEPEVARAAISRAHELGAKVTAHCFGEESVAQLVEAGIDGIEHGTGMDESVIDLMVANQVALVPTMVNLENFPGIADSAQDKFPRYAAHMRDLHQRRLQTLRLAREAGVAIFAGTDAGGVLPHGLVGQEVERLGTIGDADFALGAASWRARAWLGRPGLEPGAPADLVVLDEDPRANLAVLRHPRLVVLRGRVVRAATVSS
ncbi:amidohydrolase family protein [Aestuariimicrobium ganziense]|uniref:amidohydrolase family protein n=1 Tax=Aestuariimicrobium ganziense TaxID=2773677 RepID=UPI001943B164|nr:amidohydrolase family protein [Aestuariimicrobium ganziense]